MSPNNLIPISDDQAKAIQEAAKLGAEGLQTVRAFGGYLREILGTVPGDIIGLVGGDWLRFKRIENVDNLGRKTNERLRARNVRQPEAVSLSLGLPLLKAAADEDREELVDLWSRLLAAAMDPARRSRVRSSFIDKLKRFDPIDGAVLIEVQKAASMGVSNMRDFVAQRLQVGPDQIEVSFRTLFELGIILPIGVDSGVANTALMPIANVHLSAVGREFLVAISD